MSNDKFLQTMGMSKLQIPDELKNKMLWAVSTMKILDPETGRLDKSPRNPKTGERLSVTDPKGWSDFYTCMNAGYPALGMMLSKHDPYAVIDLDKTTVDEDNDLARRIYDAFDSYTEKSVSGKGVHIILKGPAQAGRRKRNVEVYSQERYIICTGNILKQPSGDMKIMEGGKDLQRLIDGLTPSVNPDTLPLIDNQEERESDQQILIKMFDSQNTTNVRELYETLPSETDDWSKLDAQLASHICFYTKNQQQALRIFRGSRLYRGDKSTYKKSGYERQDKYEEDYLLRRTFAMAWGHHEARAAAAKDKNDEAFKKLVSESNSTSTSTNDSKAQDSSPSPEIITEDGEVLNMYASVQALVPDVKKTTIESKFGKYDFETFLPPVYKPTGLVGEIADYIYNSAPSPVLEVAIAGAISFVGGVAGRHYNINGSGLGMYTLLLAKTGRGKEAAASGISRLMNSVSENVPAVMMFAGPSHIASGQGLIRAMGEAGTEENIPSKLLVLSEFGHTLKIITNRDATSAEINTRRALLDFYSKNAWGSYVNEGAYADKQNNTKQIASPNIALFGDTTPSKFFDSINLEIIEEGFLPRFFIIEYDGEQQDRVEGKSLIPPTDLITRTIALTHQVVSMRDQNQMIAINIADDAKEYLDSFKEYCRYEVGLEKPTSEIWNRGHLNALRLSGIIAVGNNIFEPTVTLEDAQWAVYMIRRSALSLTYRFDEGQFGIDEAQMEASIVRRVKIFFDNFQPKDPADPEKLTATEILEQIGGIPHNYIHRHMARNSAFKKATGKTKMSSTLASIIGSLVNQGFLTEIDRRMLGGFEKSVSRMAKGYIRGPDYDKF